jgi:hypothetical protein
MQVCNKCNLYLPVSQILTQHYLFERCVQPWTLKIKHYPGLKQDQKPTFETRKISIIFPYQHYTKLMAHATMELPMPDSHTTSTKLH